MKRILIAAVAAAALFPATASAECHYRVPKTEYTAAPVPAAWAAQMAVLRRPQTDADREIGSLLHPDKTLRVFYNSSMRLLRTEPDGGRWFLFISKSHIYKLPKKCLRTMSVHEQRVTRHLEEASRRQARMPQVNVIVYGGESGTSIVGGRLDGFIRGLSIASGGGAGVPTTTAGLVPDGVASVDLAFRDGSTQTVPVEGNLWITRTSFSAIAAIPTTVVWHAADGSVIKTVQTPS